jgi:hypothetical protein
MIGASSSANAVLKFAMSFIVDLTRRDWDMAVAES